jgi:hypothetical protein
MRINLWLLVLAAVAIPSCVAANPAISLTPPNYSFEVSLAAGLLDAAADDAALAPGAFAPRSDGERYAIRVYRPYRPRPYRRPRPGVSPIPFAAQLHIGFFSPSNKFDTGVNGGFRIGPQFDPHIMVGVGMDWWRRSSHTTVDLGTVETPGGFVSEELLLSETSANLLPFLFFVQVNGDDNMPVIPYAGFGAGYEWLFLSADDFVTGQSFDETFGGFGWQVWAGAGLPLGSYMRFNGEIFFNQCDVGSDVDVSITGRGVVRARDVISMDGVGMRFGVSWQF